MDRGQAADGPIGFADMARELWKGRWTIVLATAVGSAAAVAYALAAREVYRSEALVQLRTESKGAGALGGLAASLGGFAEFAGLSLGGSGDRSVAIATLKSRTVVEAFLRDENVLPKLYRDRWDEAAGRWKDPAPTTWEGYNDFLADVLRITDDKKTGLVTVAVEWEDPEEAQRWASLLIARTNDYLKAKAIEEGERNLAYLQDQSGKIGQIELRQSLYGLVETELKKLMLAKGGEEFAIRTVDAAVVPQMRIWPRRTRIAIVGFLLGGMTGVLLVLGRRVLRGA